MARQRALRAEVVLRVHEALAKILLPDAVHEDARRQRVRFVHQPAREVEAVRLTVGGGLERMQRTGEMRLHVAAVAGEVALDLEESATRLGGLAHHHRGVHLGFLGAELLDDRLMRLVLRRVLHERRDHHELLRIRALRGRRVENLAPELRHRLTLLRRHAAFPRQLAVHDARVLLKQVRDVAGHLRLDVRRALRLVGRSERQVRLVLIVQHRVEAEVFLLRDGVEFVVVAVRARDGQAQPRVARRRHAVHDRLDAELLLVYPALLVDLRVAMEARRNFLLHRRVGQHVARELFDGELVEGQIPVQRGDDPVAVTPDAARRVNAVAVRVRVTRHVQPPATPALAVVRRRQQPVHKLLVSIRRLVIHERVHLGGHRRQAKQVQREPANQRDAVGLERGRELLLREPGADERINRILDSGFWILDSRHHRPLRRNKRPMHLAPRLFIRRSLRALVNPPAHQRDLRVGQRRLLVWHPRDVLVRAGDDLHQQAVGRLAGLDGRAVLAALQCEGRRVEPEAVLGLRRAVALVTMLGEQRLDLLHVIHRRGGESSDGRGDCSDDGDKLHAMQWCKNTLFRLVEQKEIRR